MPSNVADKALVQTPASSFNPSGLTGPMVQVERGISVALEAVGNFDRIAVTDVAIPPEADKTKPIAIRVGWSSGGTTGDVSFGLSYTYLEVGTDTTSSADGEVLVDETVPAIANSYLFTNFILPVPSADTRVLKLRLTRYGLTDTSNDSAFIEGIVTEFSHI